MRAASGVAAVGTEKEEERSGRNSGLGEGEPRPWMSRVSGADGEGGGFASGGDHRGHRACPSLSNIICRHRVMESGRRRGDRYAVKVCLETTQAEGEQQTGAREL